MQAFPTFPRMQSLSVAVLAGAQCLVAGRVEAGDAAKKTPLQDYVSQKDDSFSWKQVNRKQVGGLSSVRLEFVSQTWRGHPWRHEMLMVRPTEARNPDIGFLLVSGDGGVDKSFELLRLLAVRAGATAAVINHVPNQPLYDGRKEDALIAYTFDQYVRSGDTTWPLLFPMVRSAARGMDVMEAVAQKEFGAKINRFVMSGASKRGWTTWLTGAVDPRVKAIAPMVFDMLNMKVQTQWAEQMYGRQSEQIQDYTQYRFDARMDEPRVVELRGWIDPFSYKSRYNIPKLILLGTNDPYWVVDSLRHYWSALPEPKLIFQTPNAGHDLAGGGEAHLALAMFYQMVADHQTMPSMSWQFQTNSTNSAGLEVIASQPAKTFRLWTATSRDRDFRDDQWSSVVLTSNVPRVAATIKSEPGRYRAYLVEAEFTASTGHNFKLSTEARVIPDGSPAAIKPRE